MCSYQLHHHQDVQVQGNRATISTAISKLEISLPGFAFVDDTDLVADADNVHISGTTMIVRFQSLITCLNSEIRGTSYLITGEDKMVLY